MKLTQEIRIVEWDEDRIGRFDFAKGIYLLGSVFLHSWSGFITASMQDPAHSKLITLLNCLVRLCAMGSCVLMMICGYDFRKRNILGTLRKQLRQLWKPYVLTMIAVFIGVAAVAIVSGAPVWPELRRKALPFLFAKTEWNDCFGFPLNGIGPIWFIVVYVTGSVLLNAVLRLKDERGQCIAVALMYLCGTSVTLGKFLRFTPFGLQRALYYLPFLYTGYLLNKYRFFSRKYPPWMVGLSFLLCLLCIYEDRNDLVCCLVCGLTMLLAMLWMCGWKTKLTGWLEWMGRNITTFCCFNTFVYVVLPLNALEARFAQKPWISGMIAFLVYFAVCIVGCIVVDRIKAGLRRKKRMAL